MVALPGGHHDLPGHQPEIAAFTAADRRYVATVDFEKEG
jgi:hypothetical protein